MPLWGFKKRKARSPFLRNERRAKNTHYIKHKELAREIIHERLSHWNRVYSVAYGRVAVRNQKRCWGSCSEHGNLNFNYKIIFLPESLMDYIIVHELCHLRELNHSPVFWKEVARAIPDYKKRQQHLRKMTHIPQQGFPSSILNTRI